MDRMKPFAPGALLLSGIGLLVSFALYFIQREWNLYLQIALAVTVISFALFIYFDPDRARGMFTGRQAKYGSNALLMAVAFIGIVGILNWIMNTYALDWGLRWDLTEDQSRTLAPETIETLHTLTEPIHVQAFFTNNSITSQTNAKDMLDDFKTYASGNLTYEFINPDLDPFTAQQANITRDGTLVFQLGENRESVTIVSEREFTNAILRLLNPGEKGVYFLSGHGERSIDASGDDSISQTKIDLRGKNYVVGTVNLLAGETIPEDAIALVVSGPTQPYTPAEVDIIAGFVDGGGALIVAEEPFTQTEFGDTADPLAAYLLGTWGIELGNNLIVDPVAVQFFGSPFIAVSSGYGDHPISTDLAERQLASYFPLARSVRQTADGVPNVAYTDLVLTSEQSWAESDTAGLEAGDNPAPGGEGDIAGPVSVGIAAENSQTGGRLVVFGDGDFFANSNYSQFGNGILLTNSVDWATEQDDLITLTPRETTQRVIVPPQGSVINMIAFGSVILIPGLTLIAGIVVWVRRRRRA
jgi:ABC-type uncharacterized transport system involved in gliding motility auxiliary subunit